MFEWVKCCCGGDGGSDLGVVRVSSPNTQSGGNTRAATTAQQHGKNSGGAAEMAVRTAATTSSKQQVEAISSIVSDIQTLRETRIPSFEWRFRRGFGQVAIACDGAVKVAAALEQLAASHAVTTVQFHNMKISDVGAEALARVLRRDRRLTSLNLSGNDIAQRGACALGDALRENRTLLSLTLQENPLGPAGVEAIARGALASNITQLHLGSTHRRLLSDSAALALKDLLSDRSKLTSFAYVGEDSFSCASLGSVLRGLSKNATLQELSLGGCVDASLQVPSQARILLAPLVEALCQEHSCLTSLELRLPIGTAGASVIAEALGSSTKLRSLDVSKCGLNAEGLRGIGRLLPYARSLRKLVVSCQDTSLKPSVYTRAQAATPLSEICTALHQNRSITELDVADIAIFDEDLENICGAIEASENYVIRRVRHAPASSDALATRLDNLLAKNEKSAKGSTAAAVSGATSGAGLRQQQAKHAGASSSSIANAAADYGAVVESAGASPVTDQSPVAFGHRFDEAEHMEGKSDAHSRLAQILSAGRSGRQIAAEELIDLDMSDAMQ